MRSLRLTTIVSLLGLSCLSLAASAPALAFDVTGTYLGKARCKGFGDGRKFGQEIPITAQVSQSGRDLNIEFAGLSFLSRASGVAIADARKPDKGELGFVSCDTEPEPVFGVTGRAKVSTKPSKGTGTIKFVTLVVGLDLGGGLGITDGAFTCTGTIKRTGITPPAVGDCPTT